MSLIFHRLRGWNMDVVYLFINKATLFALMPFLLMLMKKTVHVVRS